MTGDEQAQIELKAQMCQPLREPSQQEWRGWLAYVLIGIPLSLASRRKRGISALLGPPGLLLLVVFLTLVALFEGAQGTEGPQLYPGRTRPLRLATTRPSGVV